MYSTPYFSIAVVNLRVAGNHCGVPDVPCVLSRFDKPFFRVSCSKSEHTVDEGEQHKKHKARMKCTVFRRVGARVTSPLLA